MRERREREREETDTDGNNEERYDMMHLLRSTFFAHYKTVVEINVERFR